MRLTVDGQLSTFLKGLIMKHGFLYFAGIFLILTGCSNGGNRPENNSETNAIHKRLQVLLDQKEYFRLEAQLNLLKDSLENKERLYYQSFVDNAFNRNDESIRDIDTLLTNYIPKLTDSVKADLYLLQGDCYFKIFQYAKAALCDSMALYHYSAALDNEKIGDIKNDLLIRNALQRISPQQINIEDSATIRWKKDRIGLIEIPIKTGAALYDGIFDTRANISSITQTYAAKLGLKILPVSYEEGSGITGIRFKTGLGIADSLYIGNILVRNAVFQVMPDSILYIAPVKFSLNIIIGFPIIEQLEELHLYKDGRMIIPLNPSKSELHNFALDGLDPVISLIKDSDTLCFHFDLGAVSTTLYYAYFEKYKQHILKEGHKKTVEFGGAGGIQKKEVYVLPELHLLLGDKKVTVDSVDVLMQKIFPKERFYGNLGQDFAGKFNEIIFNFKYMYIKAM
jgi:hypothetical protein